MNTFKKVLIFLVFLLSKIYVSYVSASENNIQADISGFEFIDQDYREIFFALSTSCGIPINCDETVKGRTSLRCTGRNFEETFSNFIESENLFVRKNEKEWIISRFNWSNEDDKDLFEANGVSPSVCIQQISKRFEENITWNLLPETKLWINCRGKCTEDFLDVIVRMLGKNWEAEKRENGFHIEKKENVYSREDDDSGFVHFERKTEGEKESFVLDVKDSNALTVLEKIFTECSKPHVCIDEKNIPVKRICFESESFEYLVHMISRECGICVFEKENVWYIAEKKEQEWKQFFLKNISVEKIKSLLLRRFNGVEILETGRNVFYVKTERDVLNDVEKFIEETDVRQSFEKISLNYIKTDDLLERLPPFLERSQIIKGTEENIFFFDGSRENFESLKSYISEIDVSVKRLRYDLFVVQYERTEDEIWDPSLSLRYGESSGSPSANVTLGSVLNFNVDIPDIFGVRFAASLQSKLNDSEAKVYADTTLFGINGGTIEFRNTSTFRYRDNNLDPETGKPVYSGVTREISSGLQIDITGWISGDGMITSRIQASITRQGADTSSTTGNPPPTSEKEINTEVIGKKGEPIVLTGLLEWEENESNEKVPWVCRIPIIGKLFKSKTKTKSRSDLVIYLVPGLVEEEGEINEEN